MHMRLLRGYQTRTWFVLGVCSLITGLFLFAVITRLTGPTDQARLAPGDFNAWQPDGLIVEELGVETPDDHGLRTGDKVIAVDGVAMVELANRIFTLDSSGALRLGQTRRYTVLRGDQLLVLSITPTRYAAITLLKHSWAAWLLALTSLLIASFVFVAKPNETLVQASLLWSQGLWGMVVFVSGLQIGDLLEPWRNWLFVTIGTICLFLYGIGLVRFALLIAPASTAWLARLNRPGAVALTYSLPYVTFVVYTLARLLARSQRNALAWFADWIPASGAVLMAYFLLFGLCLAASYRANRDPMLRRKIRMIAYGGVLTCIMATILSLSFVTAGRTLVSVNTAMLFGLPLTLAFAMAIFRYRLLDIDFVINRTLVYATVSFILALIYFGGFVTAQVLFGPAVGRGWAGDISAVVSTLLAVAVFAPLRRRAQTWVDRRFYRSKYMTQQVYAIFGAAARSQVDLGALTANLGQVVADTMQPRFVAVWVPTKENE
jgi:hypothetical protein